MNDYSSPMVTYDEIVEALKAILDCSRNNGYLDEYSFLNAKYDTIKKNPLQTEKEQALINAIQAIEIALNEANDKIRKNLEEDIEKINAVNILTIPTDYAHTFELRKLAAQEEFVYKLTEMSLPLEVLMNHSEEAKQIESLVDFANVFEEIEESGIVTGIPKDEEPGVDEKEEKVAEPTEEKEQTLSVQFDLLADVEEKKNETVVEEESKVALETEEASTEETPVVEEEAEEINEQEEKTLGKIKLIKKALEKAKEKKNEQLIKVLEQQLDKEINSLKS